MRKNRLTGNATEASTAKSGAGVKVHNSITLDPTTPIPLEKFGTFSLTLDGKRYIPFLEPNDNFFQILLEAKLLSPTNLACINSKTQYCIGDGWYLQDAKEDKALNDFAKNLNKKGQTLNDILRAVFDNLHTAGNCFIDVVRVKVGSSKYIKVYVKQFTDCRLSMPMDADDIPASIIYSKRFRGVGVWNMKGDDFVELPIYTGSKSDTWFKDQSGNEHICIFLKNEVSGYDYYGMPSNVASLPQQILEYKAARYNLDNFDNNLVVGGLIILQGNLTQEEANKLGKNIIMQHSGDGKRGRYVILSSENGIENTKVVPFERQEKGDFIEYDKHLSEKIIASNNWDPLLAGFSDGSGRLGNGGNAFIRSIYDIKQNTVIKPTQNYVIEKFLTPLFQICDDWMGTKFSSHQVGIKSKSPISFLGDIAINAIVTKDEARQEFGMQPLTNGHGNDIVQDAIKTTASPGQNV